MRVLWAAELAGAYAPELQVLGVATTAPGAELATTPSAGQIPASRHHLRRDADRGGLGATPTGCHWAGAHPRPAARRSTAYGTCLEELASDPATPVVRPGDLLTTSPWPALLARNTPGHAATPAPVLIAQGTDDEVVGPGRHPRPGPAAVPAGDTVEPRSYRGAGHFDILEVASADMIGWTGDRLAGRPARSTLPTLRRARHASSHDVGAEGGLLHNRSGKSLRRVRSSRPAPQERLPGYRTWPGLSLTRTWSERVTSP